MSLGVAADGANFFWLVIGRAQSCNSTGMKIRKIAALTALVLSSFAATNVAPSKSELEAMYSKAFRDFDANNFPEALKQLDEIDIRQPDLAESQNLRGVILMRQGIYDKAEAALLEAVRIDPKFWNARFNLAEVPFLKKDWAEARTRFQQLLSGNVSELEGDATQLIQYKILLTYLLDGKENMVDGMLAKFELAPDTPAVHYANAAIALQHKNAKEAKDWMGKAEKNFSPQLNKLFAESLYEVGWLEKPAGQARASLPLTTAAERAVKAKAFARSRFEQAQQALQQRDFATAQKFIDEADASDPNQAPILNLRGEILMEQKQFSEAEAAFKKASKIDPKFREAQYNLAQIPFKEKDYAKARERFETLFQQTPGGEKNQAAQIIQFKIFMTLLLEDKESRAQTMMEQFQFTGDTPALYYAQAAWEFKHNNPDKATDWVASAKRIYSPALNNLFGDAFYDLGWVQSPAIAASVAPATEAAVVMSAQPESFPAIEPSPIPGAVVAAKQKAPKQPRAESVRPSSPAASSAITGVEATTSRAAKSPPTITQAPVVASSQSTTAETPAKPEKPPAAPVAALSPTVETPVAASLPAKSAVASTASAGQGERTAIPPSNVPIQASAAPIVVATPATVLAPVRVQEWSRPAMGETRQKLLVGGLLLAGIFLLAWVIVPEIRRRTTSVPVFRHAAPVTEPRVDEVDEAGILSSQTQVTAASNSFIGGPPRVSLQLKASEPSLRRGVLALGKSARAFPGTSTLTTGVPEPIATSAAETAIAEPPLALAETFPESAVRPATKQATEPASVEFMPDAGIVSPFVSPMPEMDEPSESTEEVRTVFETAVAPVVDPLIDSKVEPEMEPLEPIGQGQPIPHQIPVPAIELVVAKPFEAPSFFSPTTISTEPSVPQSTSSLTMPEPTQIPTAAPVTRTPAAPAAAGTMQPADAMHTAVQITFSFEVASMQLTPTFKMGALQVRPTSKIVTMRLAPSQQPQPAVNLQATFEIAKIQPTGGALGTLRLTPSQQQKPTATGSPSFAVAGLQLVSNFEAAPVQLTPSQQGQASVLVTASFQIATIEFSPSFEIASLVLNSTSKQVAVQLPGASSEVAPMFEIANLQLTGGGEIGMLQLNLLGHGPKRA